MDGLGALHCGTYCMYINAGKDKESSGFPCPLPLYVPYESTQLHMACTCFLTSLSGQEIWSS